MRMAVLHRIPSCIGVYYHLIMSYWILDVGKMEKRRLCIRRCSTNYNIAKNLPELCNITKMQTRKSLTYRCDARASICANYAGLPEP